MLSNKTIISLSLLCSSLLQANELTIYGKSFFAPKELGITALTHNNLGFNAIRDGKKHTIQNAFVDKTIRNVPSDKLIKFLEKGYLSVNKMSDGQYTLKANVKGLGGGAYLAWLFYGGTKSLCYGTVIAAGTGVIATGVGAGVAAAGLGGTAVGTTLTAATTKVAASSILGGMSSTAAGGVAAGLASTAGGAALATEATAAAITATGSIAAFHTAVEVASVFMGALGAAIPGPI